MAGAELLIESWGFLIAVFLKLNHSGPPGEDPGTAASKVLGHHEIIPAVPSQV